MRQLKVLELFSGTRSVSKAFERHGHETFCVDWDERFEADLHDDIEFLKASKILRLFGRPDVIHLSPDCATFSMAAISRHRSKNPSGGGLVATSEYAKKCDRVDVNCMRPIRDLSPLAFWIENPTAGMRKADWIQWAPIWPTSYCQWTKDVPLEIRRRKATDIWTNVPNPQIRVPCKNGDPCHVPAPRGARTGTQGIKGSVDRSRIPDELCEHIVRMSEEYIESLELSNDYLASMGRRPITPVFVDEEAQPRLF